MIKVLAAFGVASALSSLALAQEPAPAAVDPALAEAIQVTATRIPEDVLDVPASLTVITAEQLAARGARDLASALALAAGVAVAPGGDGGPASSVPELMGLREFDAFLLVVDEVPWGGAFNPALSTLDLSNVERIEVLRGAAPVLYGATSFVGVIHVIHRAPEDTPREVALWSGSYGSGGAAATSPLGGRSLRQSLSAGFESQGLADERAGFDRAHALWNGAAQVGEGQLRLSLDLTALRQTPGSPHPRQGRVLSPLIPLDANHNPSDAKIDEDRLHLAAAYARRVGEADWTSTLALTSSRRTSLRGFLREEFDVPPGESNADGFRQRFDGDDYYLDTHLAWQPSTTWSLVAGLDLLGGKGTADSLNFEYEVPLDGADPPRGASQPVDERPRLEDERTFAGLYAQALWRPTSRWTLDAGMRLNRTRETQTGEGDGETSRHQRSDFRLSGGLGASFQLWSGAGDAVWLFADVKDAFKPAAVDFGPEAEGEILKPETARTYEAGVKGVAGAGKLDWQASAFQMDFENLLVARTIDGRPALENGGSQRFEGVEIEGKWRLREALSVEGSYAWHSARFRDFVQEFDGVPTQLAGNRLEMSPDRLAALGVFWAPERGWRAYARGGLVGERFLTKRNTAVGDAYTMVAAGLSHRFEHGEVGIDADNLTDERPPVSESELGESSYYRLPARSYRASLTWRF